MRARIEGKLYYGVISMFYEITIAYEIAKISIAEIKRDVAKAYPT